MKQYYAFTLVLFVFSTHLLIAQDKFPGGVPGAEAWYIADHQGISDNVFANHGDSSIQINSCGDVSADLMNFNHAIRAEKLCLTYNASLENSTSRNTFFVGLPKPYGNGEYSTLTTEWNPSILPLIPLDSIANNRFDHSLKSTFVNNEQYTTYEILTNAHVNFFHWNIYQTERKFKSYGKTGETSFYIGKDFTNSEAQAQYFDGIFPEFISYPYELTENQRRRVESYLALKYGVTLVSRSPYLNSKNTAFWRIENNNLFSNRIFGIGRDDISGLNQLQSESVHNSDYLIASVGELMPTNLEKQADAHIANNDFIVFGDTGSSVVIAYENHFGIRFLKRIWLSQSTGDTSQIPMSFKFNYTGVMAEELAENPDLVLWMLHDKFINNDQVSNFDNQYVNFYTTPNMDGEFAYFGDVFFDTDNNIHDQFTFGLGPKMIVQVRFPDTCKKEYYADVVISGGTAPYEISISNNSNTTDQHFTTTDNIQSFLVVTNDTYTVTVKDDTGFEVITTVDAIYYQMDVNLGPDQLLSMSQSQITLNAGQYIDDPNATYQWYHNGLLLSHNSSSINVTEPGEYTVVVTSGNRSCVITDSVNISYNFEGTIVLPAVDCESTSGSFTLNLTGGIAPFTTILTSNATPIHQVHSTSTYVFVDIPFNNYDLVTTDSNGNTFTGTLAIVDPLEGIENTIIQQLFTICEPVILDQFPAFTFSCPYDSQLFLDASSGVTNPNVAYEWFVNGNQLNINGPIVELTMNLPNPPSSDIYNSFTVVTRNLSNNCTTSETFYLTRAWGIVDANGSNAAPQVIPATPEASKFITKVYPNPSASNTTFYYEVSSTETFDGIVEIYTPTGALLEQVPVEGRSQYGLSFELTVSGVYFICISTNGIRVTDRIIIK